MSTYYNIYFTFRQLLKNLFLISSFFMTAYIFNITGKSF